MAIFFTKMVCGISKSSAKWETLSLRLWRVDHCNHFSFPGGVKRALLHYSLLDCFFPQSHSSVKFEWPLHPSAAAGRKRGLRLNPVTGEVRETVSEGRALLFGKEPSWNEKKGRFMKEIDEGTDISILSSSGSHLMIWTNTQKHCVSASCWLLMC